MNWVGGVRSRIRQQSERKRQKEFFERKRLAARVHRIKDQAPEKSRGVSQDLVTIHTISKIHGEKSHGHPQRNPVVHVNLDKARPLLKGKGAQHVHLPNQSPCREPSKLQLMEANPQQTHKAHDCRTQNRYSDIWAGNSDRESTKLPTSQSLITPASQMFPIRYGDVFPGQRHASVMEKESQSQAAMPPPTVRRSSTSLERHFVSETESENPFVPYSKPASKVSFNSAPANLRADVISSRGRLEHTVNMQHFEPSQLDHQLLPKTSSSREGKHLRSVSRMNPLQHLSHDALCKKRQAMFVSEDFQKTPLKKYEQIEKRKRKKCFNAPNKADSVVPVGKTQEPKQDDRNWADLLEDSVYNRIQQRDSAKPKVSRNKPAQPNHIIALIPEKAATPEGIASLSGTAIIPEPKIQDTPTRRIDGGERNIERPIEYKTPALNCESHKPPQVILEEPQYRKNLFALLMHTPMEVPTKCKQLRPHSLPTISSGSVTQSQQSATSTSEAIATRDRIAMRDEFDKLLEECTKPRIILELDPTVADTSSALFPPGHPKNVLPEVSLKSQINYVNIKVDGTTNKVINKLESPTMENGLIDTQRGDAHVDIEIAINNHEALRENTESLSNRCETFVCETANISANSNNQSCTLGGLAKDVSKGIPNELEKESGTFQDVGIENESEQIRSTLNHGAQSAITDSAKTDNGIKKSPKSHTSGHINALKEIACQCLILEDKHCIMTDKASECNMLNTDSSCIPSKDQASECYILTKESTKPLTRDMASECLFLKQATISQFVSATVPMANAESQTMPASVSVQCPDKTPKSKMVDMSTSPIQWNKNNITQNHGIQGSTLQPEEVLELEVKLTEKVDSVLVAEVLCTQPGEKISVCIANEMINTDPVDMPESDMPENLSQNSAYDTAESTNEDG